jgi:molybdenum cofactor cytidylyltransferase
VHDGCRIAAVVLAAGLSRRMGEPKALLTLGDKPLIVHVIDAFRSAGAAGAAGRIDPIIVVTGHAAEQIQHILTPFSVHVVHNEAYASGEMLSSVKRGVSEVLSEHTPPVDAFFIALSDQPLVLPRTISAMRDAWVKHSRPAVMLPTFKGKRGHPILLSTSNAKEILSLPEDATLKVYTSRHTKHTLEVNVDDPAILHDLDTPADYQAARQKLNGGTAHVPTHPATPTTP